MKYCVLSFFFIFTLCHAYNYMWVEQVDSALRKWRCISSSDDGNKLIAGVGSGGGNKHMTTRQHYAL